MNILHLFSDWKWTGPAEPVLQLCQELGKRGHNITFAYRRPPPQAKRSIAAFADQFGVAATDQFKLNRYFSLVDNPRDIKRLRRFIRDRGIQIVHTHLTHDHFLATAALMLCRRQALVVRSDHKRDSITPSLGNRWLLRKADGIITFSNRAREHLLANFRLPPSKVCKINPAIDCEKFRPGEPALRKKWGLTSHDVAVGVVARFQKYRKTDLFLEAIKQAVPRAPNLKAILIGRSSQIQETVHRPIKELGLANHVVVAGYLTDQYVAGLASLDAFVFLIAGSDGTGRALREAMAMGLPAVANNVGMLPEMVEDGKSGLVFNNTAQDLAEKLVRLTNDRGLRERLGEAALQRARHEFSLTKQADAVESFYSRLLGETANYGLLLRTPQ